MWKVSISLSSLKSKVDKLDIDKLVFVPVDLKKASDVVDKEVVKKDEYDELFKYVIAIQACDTSELVKKAEYNSKIDEIEKKYLIMIMINILLLKSLIN